MERSANESEVPRTGGGEGGTAPDAAEIAAACSQVARVVRARLSELSRRTTPALEGWIPPGLRAQARLGILDGAATLLEAYAEQRPLDDADLAAWTLRGSRAPSVNLADATQVARWFSVAKVAGRRIWSMVEQVAREQLPVELAAAAVDRSQREAFEENTSSLVAAVLSGAVTALVKDGDGMTARRDEVLLLRTLDREGGYPSAHLQHQAAGLGLPARGHFAAVAFEDVADARPTGWDLPTGAQVVVGLDAALLYSDASAGDSPLRAGFGPGCLPRELQGRVGLGPVQQGLPGAATSLRHARLALRAGQLLDRPVARSTELWFETMVLAEAPVFTMWLRAAIDALGDPEDRQTMQAVSDCNGVVSDAGERLHLHPNSVRYRVNRFTKRAWVDPRQPEGLMLLRAALLLHADETSPPPS